MGSGEMCRWGHTLSLGWRIGVADALPQFHVVDPPGFQGEIPGELWSAASAHRQQSNQNIPAHPSSGFRPILGASSFVAELKSESA